MDIYLSYAQRTSNFLIGLKDTDKYCISTFGGEYSNFMVSASEYQSQ